MLRGLLYMLHALGNKRGLTFVRGNRAVLRVGDALAFVYLEEFVVVSVSVELNFAGRHPQDPIVDMGIEVNTIMASYEERKGLWEGLMVHVPIPVNYAVIVMNT